MSSICYGISKRRTYYKVTALKDMPGWHAGESYGGIKEDKYPRLACIITGDGKCLSDLIKIACDYPEYAKVELDTDAATDLRCPNCGNTHVFFKTDGYRERDDDVEYCFCTIGVICSSCGLERDLGKFRVY